MAILNCMITTRIKLIATYLGVVPTSTITSEFFPLSAQKYTFPEGDIARLDFTRLK